MKKVLALVAAAAALVSFNPVQAEPTEGFYVGGLAGGNFLQTSKKHGRHAEFKTGYDVGGLIGYELCDGIRLEGEFTYRHNCLKSLKFSHRRFSGDRRSNHKGNFRSMSYMANIIYDIPLSCQPCGWDFFPYVGAGIGYSSQRFSSHHCHDDEFDGDFDFRFRRRHNNHKKNGFAWQVIAGLGYEIDACTDIALEYRFNKGRLENFYNHSLNVALRYHF